MRWLGAHGDFNTPETTASGFLGGMCLAGACGLWDTGFGAGLDPSVLPASLAAPGGLSPEALNGLLTDVARVATVVGAEITSAAPGHGGVVSGAIAPLPA